MIYYEQVNRKEKMNTYKALQYLKEKFGIDMYNEVCRVIWEQQERINELTKQRDNWKKKYYNLKEIVK